VGTVTDGGKCLQGWLGMGTAHVGTAEDGNECSDGTDIFGDSY